MLAQNFLSYQELEISEAQHQSLISTLGRMERGEIPSNKFNMMRVGEPDCGTVGCILGWARGSASNPVWDNSNMFATEALRNLFMPDTYYEFMAWGAKVEQAAMALRSYLTTGHANWREAMQCPTKD